MGRPSKLSDELQEEICDFIAKGNPFERACRLAGIGESTFHSWRHRGAAARSGRYHDFVLAVREAEERFKAWNVAQIMKAAQSGTWQAAAWLLERKYPHEFARRTDVHMHEEPVPVEVSAAERDAVRQELEEFYPEGGGLRLVSGDD